jgi:hypothetical protein
MLRSIMGFYLIMAAFSVIDRNRRANVIPLTLGPHGSNFDDVVKCLEELRNLDAKVKHGNGAGNHHPRRYRRYRENERSGEWWIASVDNESETSGDTDKSNEGESRDLNCLYDDCTSLRMGLATVGNRPRYTENMPRITNR